MQGESLSPFAPALRPGYADTSVASRVLLLETAFDCGHLCSRLIDRYAGLKRPMAKNE